jgi:hypothetical protein
MGRAISIGCLQCEHHLSGPVDYKALVGNGGAGDVAAQALQFLALMGGAAHLARGPGCMGTASAPSGRGTAGTAAAAGRLVVGRGGYTFPRDRHRLRGVWFVVIQPEGLPPPRGTSLAMLMDRSAITRERSVNSDSVGGR